MCHLLAAPWLSIAECPTISQLNGSLSTHGLLGLKVTSLFLRKTKTIQKLVEKNGGSTRSLPTHFAEGQTDYVSLVPPPVRNHRSKDPFPFFNWLCHTSLSHGVFVFTSANPFPFGISCFGHFFPPPHWQRRHVDVLSRPSFRRRRAWVGHCRKVEGQKEITEKHESKKREAKKNG